MEDSYLRNHNQNDPEDVFQIFHRYYSNSQWHAHFCQTAILYNALNSRAKFTLDRDLNLGPPGALPL